MSTTLQAAIRERLVTERLAGKQPVLTLDEVSMLGGDVEDGAIDSFGPTVSALIDEFGAGIVPDEESGPRVQTSRTSPEAMAEDVAAFAKRHAEGVEQRRFERVMAGFETTFKDAATSLARQSGMSANDALSSIARGRAFDLRESGKAGEANDMFAVVKRIEGRNRPTQSAAEKVEAAIAEQAD